MLYRVDLVGGTTSPVTSSQAQLNASLAGRDFNAIGYNTQDFFIYGTVIPTTTGQVRAVVRLKSDGNLETVIDISSVDGRFAQGWLVGDVDDQNYYWTAGPPGQSVGPTPNGNGGSNWARFDLNLTRTPGGLVDANTATQCNLDWADWSFVPNAGRYLWFIGVEYETGNAQLQRFSMGSSSTNAGVCENVGAPFTALFPPCSGLSNGNCQGTKRTVGATYATADGWLYGVENYSGITVRIQVAEGFRANTQSPQSYRVETPSIPARSALKNDGARCVLANASG